MQECRMECGAGNRIGKQMVKRLEARLGTIHARQRLGLEAEHESKIFGGGIGFFHPENWYSAHGMLRGAFKLSGTYKRGRRNAHLIATHHNSVALAGLPEGCDGLKILHLSDLHLDMSDDIVERLNDCVAGLDYDLCVLTGDYRFRTFGNYTTVVSGMRRLREHLNGPVYAVLGNHDSVRMLLDFEDLGIQVLMNENVCHAVGADKVYIAGIDDAHFFGAHNMEKALQDVPWDACSILLSHTPEVYRQAAHAGADLLLCGHTHGGQVCLPGGYPIVALARVPRSFAKGNWRHAQMCGYTSAGAGSSMVDVRFNCPPEVTVHILSKGDRASRTGT